MSGIVAKKKSQSQSFQNVKVVVRVRPLNKQEEDQSVKSIVKVITPRELLLKEKKYTFDRIFKPSSRQIEVYSNVVAPLIQDVVAGYNCTVFAYGQTGSGKTFTMTGDKCNVNGNWKVDDEAGIIPRAAYHIFEELNKLARVKTIVKVSYIELYNEEIRDLLTEDESTLNLYSDTKGGLFIQGMREVCVYDSEDICKMVQRGILKKQIAPTLMNHQSSRSHTVFTISVNISETTPAGDDILKSGKINLVDLAGSENIARSGCKDIRATELANINRSLLTLGRVIHALADKAQKHIPYRDSKLTRILQDSLGGHTKTVIVATVSPANTSQEETSSTLEYATRARDIKNAPVVNEKMTKHEMIDGLVKEIDRLQRDLDAARTGTGFYVNKENYQRLLDSIMAVTGEQITPEELESKKAERIQDLEEIMKFKMRQFEETVKQCKKHEEDLQLALDKIKQKEEILEQEKYLSTYYEDQIKERFSENEYLFTLTNSLSNEKEILLAKFEKQFRINTTNETVTQSAISKVLSVTETFRQNFEDTVSGQKNLQIQCRDDLVCQRNDLEKCSKNLKVVKNSTNALKSVAVREIFEGHMGEQQEIVCGKLALLERILNDSDQRLRDIQATIPAMRLEYEMWLENFRINMEDNVSRTSTFYDKIRQHLDCQENELSEELLRKEIQLGDNRIPMNDPLKIYIQALIERDRAKLEAVKSIKNEVIEEQSKEVQMKDTILKFKQQGEDTIQKFQDQFCKTQKIQEQTKEEVPDIIESVRQYIEKVKTGVTAGEDYCQKTSEEVQKYTENILHTMSEIENKVDVGLDRTIVRIGELIESNESFVDMFDNHIESIKNILKTELLEKNMKSRHVGDTPVKGSIELPVRIKELTPREILLEQFTKTLSKVNEDENYYKDTESP